MVRAIRPRVLISRSRMNQMAKNLLLCLRQSYDEPFTKELISDGTYNILALLNRRLPKRGKPQFLCIEEPENGLHPKVVGS